MKLDTRTPPKAGDDKAASTTPRRDAPQVDGTANTTPNQIPPQEARPGAPPAKANGDRQAKSAPAKRS